MQRQKMFDEPAHIICSTFALATGTLVVGLGLYGTAAFALEPIHLKPGQCILIGSQEVCAMKQDEAQVAAKPKPTKMATCKYGDKSDEPGMKGYTLFQVVLKDDGEKTETAIKAFGSMDSDKAECEKAARELDHKLTAP